MQKNTLLEKKSFQFEIEPDQVSFPSGNKDKIFDPGIFIIKRVQSKRFHIFPLDDFSTISVISDFLLLTNPSAIKTFLSFLSGNEDKVQRIENKAKTVQVAVTRYCSSEVVKEVTRYCRRLGIRAHHWVLLEADVAAYAVMSSSSSAVTYTSVYTDSEPSKAFWRADDEEVSEGGIPRVIVLGYDGLLIQPVAPSSPDYIPGPEDPQTPPVPQDEDEREPMFIQAHDPDYVPEPIYPEYIPLEDEHEFLGEEQPLPPVDSPTAESPGYVNESDPEEDPEEYEDDETEDGLVNYLMDGGDDEDDDDGDSSRDNANDEDEDDEDEDEEEEYLAPVDSAIVIPVDEPITVWPRTSISLPPEAEVERLLAMTTPSPSPPISLSPPSTRERLARFMAPPPYSSPLLPSSRCLIQIQTLRIASTQALINAVTAALPSPPLPPLLPYLYIPLPIDRRDDISESKDVGYGIRDTWVDPAEAVPKIAPMTVGEVNTWVKELAKIHEHDTQDLYALLEDAQDSRSRISQ
ncbi:hypothetical protein Tco_0842424 [Tanacetum coccineum]|uniref:Uncharacterized protein n=1 Tax=Tanacetum coccineum TaxID=301880 RepID=A0ABQ5B2Q7_9ASTR